MSVPHLSFGELRLPEQMGLRQMPHVPVYLVLRRRESVCLYESRPRPGALRHPQDMEAPAVFLLQTSHAAAESL